MDDPSLPSSQPAEASNEPNAHSTRSRTGHASLEGLHGTVQVPRHDAGFWRKWRAYVGPALLVGVGYMDPDNWGTDLQAGAQFKYDLLWVVAAASIMAIFLQVASLPETNPLHNHSLFSESCK